MRLTLLIMTMCAGMTLAGDRYELADLQALEQQGAWVELVDHLGDIFPSKRGADWQRVAEAGATGLLGDARPSEDDALAPITLDDRLLRAFPTLKRSRGFMAKRAEVGIQALQACRGTRGCAKTDAEWTQRIFRFAQTDPQNIAVPAAAMEMNSLIADVTVPLFELALGGKPGPTCKEPGLKKAVVSALKNNTWNVDGARHVASSLCWAELKAELLSTLDAAKEDDFLRTTCDFLTRQGALTPAQTTRCAPFAAYREKNRSSSASFSTTQEP